MEDEGGARGAGLHMKVEKSYLWGLIQLQASKPDHVLLWWKLLSEKGTEF